LVLALVTGAGGLELRNCLRCGRGFLYKQYPSGHSTGTFCSTKCKKGRVQKTCPTCNKQFFTKQRKTRNEIYCSYRCRYPRFQFTCPICHEHFYRERNDAERAKGLNYCSLRCRNIDNMSPQQKRITNILMDMGLDPAIEFPISTKHWVDIVFLEKKIAIEIDGDWHTSFHRTIKNDKIKEAWLNENGWHLIRLTRDQIEFHLNDSINIILGVIN
jgi:endogenous inhibitor of DNA gyrase (YacG/DUF329 family)